MLIYSFNGSWNRFFLCEWVLKIPQGLKTSKPASFDGSLHAGCFPFLSSWEHLPAQKGWAVGSIRWPVLQRIKNGGSAPKFNNMGWYLGVKTSFHGIYWNPPPTLRPTRAVFLEEKHQVWGCSLHSCSSWCSLGSGALKSLLFSPWIRILQVEVRLAFLKVIPSSRWISFQKQAEAVQGVQRSQRNLC